MRLFLFAFFISLISYSQEYLPMLEEGSSWSVDVYYEPFDPPEPPYSWTITEQILLGDIEEVNGVEYYRVWSGDQPTCLLREENEIVYKYDESEGIDKILFDFTLEEGDVFSLNDSAYGTGWGFCTIAGGDIWQTQLTVDTVIEIEIAGELRKVITFLEYNDFFIPFQWIEGIGNITGFDMLWGWIDVTGDSQLVCFTKNGTTFYFNDATSCDNTTLNLGEQFKKQIILFPNPVIEKSILQLPIEVEIDQINIYTILGQLIKTENISSNNFIINSMDYANGLYFYQVFSNGKLIKTDKFIVK